MPETDGSKNTDQTGGTEPAGPVSPSVPSRVETALACLATAARILGIPADYEGLCRAFPSRKPDELSLILLRGAKKLGIKARQITTTIGRLDKLPQPSLLLLPDGDVMVLLRAEPAPPEHEGDDESVREAVGKGRVILFHPRGKQPFI